MAQIQITDHAIAEALARYDLLRFFKYEHLSQHLQLVSKQYSDLAYNMAVQLPHCAETTVALRKLLESKDAAVRSKL